MRNVYILNGQPSCITKVMINMEVYGNFDFVEIYTFGLCVYCGGNANVSHLNANANAALTQTQHKNKFFKKD